MTDDQRNLGSTGRSETSGVAAAGSTSTSVGQTAGNVAEAARQTAGKVSDAVGQTAQQAKETAAPLTDQVQQTAGQVADQAKQQALSQASTQKDHAASSLDAVAQALRQSGDQLRDNQQDPLANLAGTAAHQVEQFSGYVRNTDVTEMIRDVEQFARRQPAAFLGGAFTLGVLAARFLKSSSQNATTSGTGTAGRTPSYTPPSFGSNPYASSGTSRYPEPGTYGSSRAGATSAGLRGVSDSDLGGVAAAVPDRALGATSLATGPSTRTPDLSGSSSPLTPAGSGPAATGWGYTPRSGGTHPESEGR
ncbi:MAG: hypothetical protein ACR2JY_09655 [Chloroflexota bacterium]